MKSVKNTQHQSVLAMFTLVTGTTYDTGRYHNSVHIVIVDVYNGSMQVFTDVSDVCTVVLNHNTASAAWFRKPTRCILPMSDSQKQSHKPTIMYTAFGNLRIHLWKSWPVCLWNLVPSLYDLKNCTAHTGTWYSRPEVSYTRCTSPKKRLQYPIGLFVPASCFCNTTHPTYTPQGPASRGCFTFRRRKANTRSNISFPV